MEHHRPHKNASFEGYYSKFDLPSGAHLALVCCQVKGAKQKPNMVSFTYVPKHDAASYFQREVFSVDMKQEASTEDNGFVIDIPEMGYVRWYEDHTEYKIHHADFTLEAKTLSRTAWSKHANTPESWLVNLPLPLHWHVQSLASECDYKLEIRDYKLPPQDQAGRAMIHDEKNWATSFPSAHMWLQARDGDRGFNCAGGQILGMEAFLLGYRSKDLELDFRPPFAVRVPGLGPFMTYTKNWNDRTFELNVQSFRQKLTVKAFAPRNTFFSLTSPFPEGHRENYLGQSFNATIEVKIYESEWLSPWKLVREDKFENASLEFGGGYYPPAGSKERFH
ncbi:hypothetical protein CKM354_000427300 [Cercospora kikuchii]|uniref:Uncharacterized protein n=1 Tax=Cercospora kikuchii TaxID=84275 RepID=A0A9P3FBC3_9PEZI|nr:uncharacterized protein CKM354_000427300 [Cercospora kikuchii]GIZ40953.1 hypothetical protein CKM354_000427300 [Cercospora kikuchii]